MFKISRNFGRVSLTLFRIPNFFPGIKINLRDLNFCKSNLNTFISLGTCCYTRKILASQGLKPKKIDGELSYPFDLARSEIASVAHFMSTDFVDFFDDILFDNSKGIFVNKKYFMEFPHDFSEAKQEKDFISRYERRISSFRKLFNDDRKLCFISIIFDSKLDVDSANKVYNELSVKRGNKSFSYLVIHISDEKDNGFRNLLSGVNYIYLKPPKSDYEKTWHLTSTRQLREVIDFEKLFITEIMKVHSS